MPSTFAIVLTAHILFAAVTVGATVAYPFWIAFAEREPEHLAFTVRAVRWSDRRVAIPAFLLTFASGMWLVYERAIPLDRPWLWLSLVLYAVILVLGFAVWGPAVRRELVALERGGTADPEYRRMRARSLTLSLVTVAALAAITVLMVARPS